MTVSIGEVFKVFYIVFLKTKKKKKKMYNFLGLCVNKKNYNFKLKNNIKGEKIWMLFDLRSPVIIKIVLLKVYYKLSFRITRLNSVKSSNKYFDDFKNKDNFILSNLLSFKRDYFYSGYLKKKIKRFKKKLRKFKKKYSYTENWKNLKIHIPDMKNSYYEYEEDIDNSFNEEVNYDLTD